RVLEARQHAVLGTAGLSQALGPAPQEQALGRMPFELGDRLQHAAEAQLLEGADGDEWVARADEDVQLRDQRLYRRLDVSGVAIHGKPPTMCVGERPTEGRADGMVGPGLAVSGLAIAR